MHIYYIIALELENGTDQRFTWKKVEYIYLSCIRWSRIPFLAIYIVMHKTAQQ